jgi:hypothetical protein
VFFFDNDLDEYMEKITLTLTLKLCTNERSGFRAEYLRDNSKSGNRNTASTRLVYSYQATMYEKNT